MSGLIRLEAGDFDDLEVTQDDDMQASSVTLEQKPSKDPMRREIVLNLTKIMAVAPEQTEHALLHLPVALYERKAVGNDSPFTDTATTTLCSLLLPPHHPHQLIYGVLARDWNAALYELHQRCYPTLVKRTLLDRMRRFTFQTLAARVLVYFSKYPHIFGCVDPPIDRLFPHCLEPETIKPKIATRNRASTRKLSVEIEPALHRHLSSNCVIPLHIIYHFLWLLHPYHTIPALAILSEKNALLALADTINIRLGLDLQQHLTLPPRSMALNTTLVKLDHLVVLLTQWESAALLSLHTENHHILQALGRSVHALTHCITTQQTVVSPRDLPGLQEGDLEVLRQFSPEAERSLYAAPVKLRGGTSQRRQPSKRTKHADVLSASQDSLTSEMLSQDSQLSVETSISSLNSYMTPPPSPLDLGSDDACESTTNTSSSQVNYPSLSSSSSSSSSYQTQSTEGGDESDGTDNPDLPGASFFSQIMSLTAY